MTDVQVRSAAAMPSGVTAQDLAGLGALLTSAGLTKLQVQGLVARIQKTAEQVAVLTIAETLEDIRKIQEARFLRIINLVGSMAGYANYIHRNNVLMAVQSVMTETPRQ